MSQSTRHIPLAIRHAVIARDGLKCRRCGIDVIQGGRGPDALHFDHIKHWAAGGGHTLENLIVSCARCNLTRPKPKNVVRTRKGTVLKQVGEDWYWVDGYTPPTPLDDAPHSFGWVMHNFDLSSTELLQAIEIDHFRATAYGPIRVLMSAELEQCAREYEERRRAEAQQRAHEEYLARQQPVRSETAAAKKVNTRDLDPERIAYWAELIEARRARQRAARAEKARNAQA